MYLRVLDQLISSGATTVSSERLATLSGHSGETVRRDIWDLAVPGLRGVGYEIGSLYSRIRSEFGDVSDGAMVIVGIGHIGAALSNYQNLATRGFTVVGLFDSDPEKIGMRLGGHTVRDARGLAESVRELGARIGVIATPASDAQAVADRLAEADVRAILNFAPTLLSTPENVWVRQVDLLAELQVLLYMVSNGA